jgi:hypothetical protein
MSDQEPSPSGGTVEPNGIIAGWFATDELRSFTSPEDWENAERLVEWLARNGWKVVPQTGRGRECGELQHDPDGVDEPHRCRLPFGHEGLHSAFPPVEPSQLGRPS